MTNYIWDSTSYPRGEDPGLDILKLEYDKLKEDERTSALIGTTPPSYQQTSIELINLMKTRAKKTAMPIHASNVQNSLKSKSRTDNLSQNNSNNLGQNVNNTSTLLEQYLKEASDAAARMAETASGYEKPFPETKIMMGSRMPVTKLGASDNLRGHLKKWEGYSHTVQDDGSGNPTGGYGNVTPGSKIGDPIGRNKAEQLLNQDIATAEQDVRRLIGNLPLAQHEFDAMVDLYFNVGATKMALPKNSNDLRKAIVTGNYSDLGNELIYSKDKGKINQGLRNRSNSRRDLFKFGIYGRRYP